MSLQPFPDDWQDAVAIVAHPDDLEYGVASAVARWTSDGKRVSYVLVTSGEAGIDGVDPALCGPMREEEERRGASIVGVEHVEFLGMADGLVVEGIDLRRAIAGAIRRLRPDIVVNVTLRDGTSAVNTNSIQLSFDGAPVTPVIQKAGTLTTIQYDPPGLLAPASFEVDMDATDYDGTVARVEVYLGNTLIAMATTEPYSVIASNISAGDYTLRNLINRLYAGS